MSILTLISKETNSEIPKRSDLPACVTCGKQLIGEYCWNCGEKRLQEHDYALHHFLKHAVKAFTHLDGNFLRSVQHLFTKPGFLTSEYLIGRRKFTIGPLQLFLIINVIYFLLQPLIGWNNLTTSLATHLNDELYSPLARRVTDAVIARHGMSLTEFEEKFNEISVTHAKSLVILMVPMFAFVLELFYRKRKRYFVEHLIFALHFFAFWLLMTSAVLLSTSLFIEAASVWHVAIPWEVIDNGSVAVQVLFYIWYCYKACLKVYNEATNITVVKAVGLGASVIFVLKFYRMILFFTTLWLL